MNARITLTPEEVEFFLHFTQQQMKHAATDPHRGVLTTAALVRLIAKLAKAKRTDE